MRSRHAVIAGLFGFIWLTGCESASAQPWGPQIGGNPNQANSAPDGGVVWECVEGYPQRIAGLLRDREKQLTAIEDALKKPPGRRAPRANYLITTASRWEPGHRLTVAFFGGSTTLRSKIVDAARTWTALRDSADQEANVSLDFGDPPTFREWKTSDGDYSADVRIAFDSDDPGDWGYWSAIGDDSRKDAMGYGPAQPSMMLYYFDRTLPPNWRTVAVHEFGHAFGFQHEHQNPKGGCDFRWADDSGYVETHQRKSASLPLTRDDAGRAPSVYTWFHGPFNRWEPPTVDANIKALPDSSAFEASAFDKISIMKYYFPALLFASGEQSGCFTPQENAKISDGDRAGFFRSYPTGAAATGKLLDKRVNVLQTALKSVKDDQLKTSIQDKIDVLNKIK